MRTGAGAGMNPQAPSHSPTLAREGNCPPKTAFCITQTVSSGATGLKSTKQMISLYSPVCRTSFPHPQQTAFCVTVLAKPAFSLHFPSFDHNFQMNTSSSSLQAGLAKCSCSFSTACSLSAITPESLQGCAATAQPQLQTHCPISEDKCTLIFTGRGFCRIGAAETQRRRTAAGCLLQRVGDTHIQSHSQTETGMNIGHCQGNHTSSPGWQMQQGSKKETKLLVRWRDNKIKHLQCELRIRLIFTA